MEKATEPVFTEMRQQLVSEFGTEILASGQGNYIDRKELGSCLWDNNESLKKFNNIIKNGLDYLYRKELFDFEGLILVDGALLAETGVTSLVNNNVIIVRAPENLRKERLKERGYSDEEIAKRMNSQLNADNKKDLIDKQCQNDGYGENYGLRQ